MFKHEIMKWKYLLWFIVALALTISACQKGELDFNKQSNYYDVEREISIPLVHGTLAFNDLLNVVPDTLEIYNLLDTLDIYYNLEYDHRDTIKLNLVDSNIYIKYAKLYYWFTNEFPVGLDSRIYMLDTIHSVIIDSILFNTNPSDIFLHAAPVDSNGIVIQDSVKQIAGMMEIDSTQADNLIQRTNKIILYSRVYANTLSIVKVEKSSTLSFRFSLDIDGKYQGYINPGN
jgi:hypothetical protein